MAAWHIRFLIAILLASFAPSMKLRFSQLKACSDCGLTALSAVWFLSAWVASLTLDEMSPLPCLHCIRSSPKASSTLGVPSALKGSLVWSSSTGRYTQLLSVVTIVCGYASAPIKMLIIGGERIVSAKSSCGRPPSLAARN